ncbi:hypothetical protein PNOK_m000125 (mitochondrion) [Pyrrhoderma noxium]|uniref:Uncharacterized protein n=1 Tax=Pyrrhoderma noxium TaxID=2282107 RepID=A0A541AXR6_9AGAM|nr:hypothetical protein PNOK_m000125 [Pyrrhoderma noxium]
MISKELFWIKIWIIQSYQVQHFYYMINSRYSFRQEFMVFLFWYERSAFNIPFPYVFRKLTINVGVTISFVRPNISGLCNKARTNILFSKLTYPCPSVIPEFEGKKALNLALPNI